METKEHEPKAEMNGMEVLAARMLDDFVLLGSECREGDGFPITRTARIFLSVCGKRRQPPSLTVRSAGKAGTRTKSPTTTAGSKMPS